MQGYEGFVNIYWEAEKHMCNYELIEKEMDISKENKISTALIRTKKYQVIFIFVWNHKPLRNSLVASSVISCASFWVTVGKRTEPGGLGITFTLAILIFLSLMTASRSSVYYSSPHIFVYSLWKNTVINHQGLHGVQTWDKPGFISCLCYLSVSFIVLRSSPVSPPFCFLTSLVDPAFEEEQGLEKDSPTSPTFCGLIKFYMAPADRCFSFYFTAPFCVFQDSTRKVELILTLPVPSCSFMLSSLKCILLWNLTTLKTFRE